MKRRMFAVAVIAGCLSLMVYGTLAYFTAEDTAHNVITSGEIDIELLEWADEGKTTPFPEDGISGVMPGTEVTKIVEVKNTGSNDAWIRVRVEKKILLSEGAEGESDSSLMQLNVDESSWIPGEDGFYYYNEILKSGDVTKPLFATVSFESSMGNLYQNSTATVDVSAYAVQADNNGQTAQDANGWPEP